MKKVLLSLAVLGFATAANAQLLNYGFEDDQTAVIDTANWAVKHSESSYNLKSANAFTGSYGLSVSAVGTAERWERVIAFKQLGLQENKSYRVSFMASGNGNINVALMEGDWNADMAVVAGNGTTYVDQIYDQPITAGGSWQRVAYVFSVPSDAILDAAYAAGTHDNPRAEGDFLRLSFTGEGNYAVDDIVVEEASIAGIDFNGTALRINFGYATNAAALAAEAGGTCVLDPSCVTVMADGEVAAVEAVEIKSNGDFCIFLTEDCWLTEENEEVLVSFTNPGNLVYSTNVAPESFTNPNCAVYSFEAEAGYYNEDFYATSVEWEEAELVASDPADNSFEIDENVAEFSFTFNKPVYTFDEENGAVVVTLDGEALTVVEASEAAATIKATRTGAPLGKGSHTLSIENVCNSKHVATSQPISVSFEVGQVQVAQTVYTELFTTLCTGANGGIPDGWTVFVKADEAHWTGGEEWAGGSACRNINVTGADGQEYTALYLCDRDGWTYAQYGDKEDARLTLPAGDIEFGLIALGHEDPARKVEYRLEDMDGNVIVEASGLTQVNANAAGAFTTIEAAGTIPVQFNNPVEQNVILKVHEPQGGYTACRVLGFKARTYEMTEGDTSDSQIVFASNFTGANMPAEGTGWLCYNNNDQLAPGSGRNGTSGMLERNFHAKMQTAAFFRECGANSDAAHRIDYGYGNGVEDGLTLPAASYEVVYYAGTWNDAGGNANGTSKVFFQIIDAESGAVVLNSEHVNIANFENGGACNGQADKVVLAFKPSTTGTYKLKAWGTTNTVWGALSFEKEGSKAVKYHTMLNEAIDLAKAELELSADAANDGTTKSALIAAVAKYSATPNGMHTPEEYLAAIAELNGLTDALKVRRETIITYTNTMNQIAEFIYTVQQKYEALECYQTLATTYAKYESTTAQSLEDEELIAATATLTNAFALTKHMTEEGVATLTAQIASLAAQVAANDSAMMDNEVVLAAGNAITDDQAIATTLKLMLTKQIYQKIVNGNPFVEYDEEFDIETPVFIDATCYIQNPGIYCVAEKHDATTIENYPGWNIDEEHATFGLRPNYGWGGWTGTATHLINKNMFLGIGWVGNDGVNVWNNVSGMPVGVYDIIIETMDRSGAGDWVDGANTWPNPERQLSYIYYQQGENEPVEQPFNCTNIGQYYGFTPDTIATQTLVGETVADVKLGAYIHAQESFAAIQKAQLQLKAKAEGFDYAAALAKMDELIASDIKVQTREDAPAQVLFFNLAGQQIMKAEGVCIKLERYADGYTVVKKVIVK